MNNFKLTKALREQINRYRIASVDLLVDELLESERERAMTILKSLDDFQIVNDPAVGLCVCQRRRKPPAPNSVARHIATHSFCRATTAQRTLLTKEDVKRYFPNLFRDGLPAGYYVDANGDEPVLGLLRVDVHFAPANRIWQRSVRLIERHRKQSDFRKLIAANQFEVTWLVPTDSKAIAIRLLASRHHHQSNPIDAHGIPLLLNLLVTLPTTFPDVEGL